MHHASDILLTIFIIFVAAQIGAEVAQRLKLPGVVGEIAAGCVVGPSLLGWLTPAQIMPGTPLDVLAEIGVILLLFSVGLETRLEDLKKVGKSAFLVGVLGVILPFAAGALWAHGEGFEWVKSLFVAAAFVATSAGITARVLQELGVLQRTESRVILGAAVIDDILAMLLRWLAEPAIAAADAGRRDRFRRRHRLGWHPCDAPTVELAGGANQSAFGTDCGAGDLPWAGLAVDPLRSGGDHRRLPRRHDRVRNAPA